MSFGLQTTGSLLDQTAWRLVGGANRGGPLGGVTGSGVGVSADLLLAWIPARAVVLTADVDDGRQLVALAAGGYFAAGELTAPCLHQPDGGIDIVGSASVYPCVALAVPDDALSWGDAGISILPGVAFRPLPFLAGSQRGGIKRDVSPCGGGGGSIWQNRTGPT